jgi:hypothetical protein
MSDNSNTIPPLFSITEFFVYLKYPLHLAYLTNACLKIIQFAVKQSQYALAKEGDYSVLRELLNNNNTLNIYDSTCYIQ